MEEVTGKRVTQSETVGKDVGIGVAGPVAGPDRERLNPWVTRETARLVKIHAAATGRTHGQVIDDLALLLPDVTIGGSGDAA